MLPPHSLRRLQYLRCIESCLATAACHSALLLLMQNLRHRLNFHRAASRLLCLKSGTETFSFCAAECATLAIVEYCQSQCTDSPNTEKQPSHHESSWRSWACPAYTSEATLRRLIALRQTASGARRYFTGSATERASARHECMQYMQRRRSLLT